MKSLNLKKVIAVGAGLALVAASVSAAVSWSDIADATAKTMKVNGVVVGASADPLDLTKATELAAAFAKKAVAPGAMVKETVTEKECTSVAGSEFGGDSKKYDTAALAALTTGVLTYTQLGTDVLKYESTLNYKIGGASYEAYAKESLGFNTTPAFDTSSKVQRLNAEFGSNDLNYDVSFGATDAGIDFNADGAWTSGTTTWTDSGASDKVEIPFLGKTYVVHKVTLSGSTIEELELFEKGAIKVFTKGDKIESLKGKDGKTYYAVLSSVVSDGSAVKMALYDSTGTVVADYENESIGESEKFAEDILESILEVTSIDNTGTSDVPNWEIEVAVGSEAVTVKDGSGFPYDSTKTSTSDYDWTATIVESFSGEEVDLTSITLKNTTKYDFKNEDGLATGKFLKFPGDLAKLEFVGLQLDEFKATSPKEAHSFEFGADVDEGNGKGIKYVDVSETTHEVPFYYELSIDDADSGDTGIEYKVDNFVFDGKTYSLKIDYVSDNNMDVYLMEGSYAASAAVGSAQDSIVDYNESVNDGVSESQLGIPNSEDTAVQYSFFAEDITNDDVIWLLLGAQEINTWDVADITIVGTDVNGEAADYTTIDTNAYLPADDGDFETAYANLGTTGAEFDDSYASIFKVTVDIDTAGADEISMVIDTETGKALAYGASSNASNAIPGPGEQLQDTYSGTLELKKGATNGLEEFYDTFGVKVTIDSDDVITLVVPEEQALVEIKVTGKGGASTETCVDENVEKEVAGPSVPFTGMPSVPADFVLKDTEATGSNYVVIGGYFVNSLWAAKDAAETATVFGSALAKEGDSVTAVLGGSVYVAGYTKEDTAAAVDALIATLAE